MNREELVQRMNAATLGVFDIASTYLGREAGPLPVARRGRAGDGRRAGGADGDQRAAGARVARAAGRHRAAGRDERRRRVAVRAAVRPRRRTARSRTPWTASPARCSRWSPTWRRCRGWSSRSAPARASRTPTTVRTRPRARRSARRPVYRAEIKSWLAAVPELAERLADGTARVLDIGCGVGWSSVCMAKAYPGVMVDGVDLDPGSIEAAERVAEAEGVADRVTVRAARRRHPVRRRLRRRDDVRDAARPGPAGGGAPRRPGGPGPGRRGAGRRRAGAVTRTPGRPTSRSGATTATACCTACPRA